MLEHPRNVRPSVREETEQRVWCKHFTGFKDDRCKLGIAYDSVRIKRRDGPFRYRHACIRADEVSHLCPHVLYPSEEEIEQAAQATERLVQEAKRWATEYIAEINAGICPHCKQPMTQVKKGWSIYASPC